MKNMILESELKVMEILWNEGGVTASHLIVKLKESLGWNDTATLQVIRKCITKGLIEKLGNNFTCRAIITREEFGECQSKISADKILEEFSNLLVSLLGRSQMATSQIDILRSIAQDIVDRNELVI
jgi:predicted transcriptional regulator